MLKLGRSEGLICCVSSSATMDDDRPDDGGDDEKLSNGCGRVLGPSCRDCHDVKSILSIACAHFTDFCALFITTGKAGAITDHHRLLPLLVGENWIG